MLLNKLATIPFLAVVLQWAVGAEESCHLFTADHMEHMACEYRKFKDGHSLRRKTGLKRKHGTQEKISADYSEQNVDGVCRM